MLSSSGSGANVMRAASEALADHGQSLGEASASVPDTPGLYAVHGGADVWAILGLGAPPDGRPLYLGKAERSLAGRDVRTHFATGKTGSSTLRRSLAGLLRDQLGLSAMPRNPAKPGHFSNYGLDAVSDEALTVWMRTHLRVSAWSSPPDAHLGELETALLLSLEPALNIDKVRTPWRAQVRAGRAALAAEARAWRPNR